jgi:hypothetical protein
MIIDEQTKKFPDTGIKIGYSEFIKAKYKTRKGCNDCHGYGIVVHQFVTNGDFEYLPCHCLRNIK